MKRFPVVSSLSVLPSLARAPRPFIRSLYLLFLCCLAGSLLAPASARAATRQNTIFLPLQINASTDREQLTVQADTILKEVLAGSDAFRRTFRLVNRAEAEKLIDYQGTWPPPVKALQAIGGTGADYVVAGSLTQLGRLRSIDLKVFDLLAPASPAYFFVEVKEGETLAQAVDKLAAQVLAHVGRQFLIARITPQGNVRIDSGAIRHQIKSKVGDIYEPARLQQDLKNVFKMGYFDDVRIKVIDTVKGKELIFAVKEKPLIGQVVITGAKELKEKTVRESISIMPNTIVNPHKVKEAAANIRALYKEEGFYNTTVKAEITAPKKGRVNVRFLIDEGSKVYIKEVRFVGNKSYKARKLKKVIQTSAKGIFSWFTDSGLLKQEVLDQDVARLTAYYYNLGYIEARVGQPEVVQKGNWLYITFNIFEGQRYRVGRITITGDLIEAESALLARLKLKDEEYLSRKILREDILRLTDYYSEKGYAYAEVNPAVSESGTEKRVDVTINISKGELVHFQRITISGNTRTRDRVIRRDLDIKEGGIFNSKALRTSHQKLYRLDFFEDIQITPEQTDDKTKMDVKVEVKEKPTGAFSIGAGYSSVDNVMLMAEISQNNFLGKGQRLAFDVNLSSTTNRYNISFTEPRVNDSKLLVAVNLYNWRKIFSDYTKDSTGGSLWLSHPIWEKWQGGLGYGYDNANLTDVSAAASQIIIDSADIHVTSYVLLGLTRDTRDSRLDPGKGSINSINVKYAGGPLGGDSAFTKTEVTSSWFFPFVKETTFHIKGSAGQLVRNPDGELPVFEKFYLGGINTIRGFSSNRISPVDPATGERIGGTRMWYTNIEWIFPLFEDAGLKGVVFFDAGNVYEDEWDLGRIKKSIGGGFRWASPMGPLRLEWGYVIGPEANEEQSNWDFSIGGSF
ncbi:MAG: outer membrane protein assembly factor BamA [Desulfobacterales bacterium]|nr:outer membrane protein assembly factor BamA [Desulfobacterales bacterium]